MCKIVFLRCRDGEVRSHVRCHQNGIPNRLAITIAQIDGHGMIKNQNEPSATTLFNSFILFVRKHAAINITINRIRINTSSSSRPVGVTRCSASVPVGCESVALMYAADYASKSELGSVCLYVSTFSLLYSCQSYWKL